MRCLKIEGRLGRLAYLKRMLFVLSIAVIATASLFMLAVYDFPMLSLKILSWMVIIVLIVAIIFAVVANITLNVRRLHDMNLSGWWFLGLFLLQFVLTAIGEILFGIDSVEAIHGSLNVLFILFYFAVPGSRGANKYGPAHGVEVTAEEVVNEIVEKAPKKKTAAKKTTIKKKAPAKKATTKKKTAKKPATKKAPAKKKTVAKKAPAKKKTTKKTTKGTK
jgi:uncharacterized membrane protein YhaH (DUF805 family)